jgi:uncharacterized protein (UPF0332 family)
LDCKRFLATAQFLRDDGREESDYRSAVSRAYYACFLELSNVLFSACPGKWCDRGSFSSKKKIQHWEVRNCLLDSDIKPMIGIGEKFKLLQMKREGSDYDMNVLYQKEDSEDAISLAEIILSDLSKVGSADIQQGAMKFCVSP